MRDLPPPKLKSLLFMILAIALVSSGGSQAFASTSSTGFPPLAAAIQTPYPNAPSHASPFTNATCDLAITKTISPSSVPGGAAPASATISITIDNVGQVVCGAGGAGTTTTVTDDPLPQGITISGPVTAPPGWSCPVTSTGVTCTETASIPPNTPATITFPVFVAGSPGTTLTNCATVSNTASNPTTSQSCAQVTLTGNPCSLSITKTASPSSVPVNGIVTFTVTVTNIGDTDSCVSPAVITTTVTDTVPAGFSNPTGSGAGWTCTTSGLTVTCTTLANFSPNPSSTITITATAATAGSYQNCADFTDTASAPPTGQSCTPITITGTPTSPCSLAISKAATPNPVLDDLTVTFTITVTNNGTASCGSGVTTTVTDAVPALGFFSHPTGTGSGWTCTTSGLPALTVTCDTASFFNIGQPQSSTITITATAATAGTYQNCAALSNTASTPQTGQACAQITVNPSAQLCATKYNDTNGDGVADAGDLPMQGWVIDFTDTATGTVLSGTTDASGNACFTVPAPATFTISEVQQQGWTQIYPSSPGTFTLTTSPNVGYGQYYFLNQKQIGPPTASCFAMDLSTGQTNGVADAPGTQDSNWQFTSGPSVPAPSNNVQNWLYANPGNGHAYSIIPHSTGGGNHQPGFYSFDHWIGGGLNKPDPNGWVGISANWIYPYKGIVGIDDNALAYWPAPLMAPGGDYVYSVTFTVPPTWAQPVSLTVSGFAADNDAYMQLDGVNITPSYTNMFQTWKGPFTVSPVGAGTHILSAHVHNRFTQVYFWTSTGLAVVASVQSAGTGPCTMVPIPEFSAIWLVMFAVVVLPLIVLRTRKRFNKAAKS